MGIVIITRIFLLLFCLLHSFGTALAGVSMVSLSGSASKIGTTYGKLNSSVIASEFRDEFLAPAVNAGISKEMLINRATGYISFATKNAPHWLVETDAIAAAAGIDTDLYRAYVDSQSRNRFLEECTTYTVHKKYTENNMVFVHKTRDNAANHQAALLIDNSKENVKKFLGITDVAKIRLSMFVNEDGLFGCGDWPNHLVKDPPKGSPTPQKCPPAYRGIMSGTILRWIAETCTTCAEALNKLKYINANRLYAGGDVNGNHLLFVDKNGTILEASINPCDIVHKYHTSKTYFSRLNNSRGGGGGAKADLETSKEISFKTFHSVARLDSRGKKSDILTNSSIAGMTVVIDPEYPELLTLAMVAMPVRGLAFPVFIGQTRIPQPLVDGTAYSSNKAISWSLSALNKKDALQYYDLNKISTVIRELKEARKLDDASIALWLNSLAEKKANQIFQTINRFYPYPTNKDRS